MTGLRRGARPTGGRWRLAIALLVLAASLAALASALPRARQAWDDHRLDRSLRERLAQRMPARGPTLPCREAGGPAPLVLLVLGQSNAGNHGEPVAGGPQAVTVGPADGCQRGADPLPGATGRGSSPWPLLAQQLEAALGRPVRLSILAVDATRVEDWTRAGSPLRSALAEQAALLHRLGLRPDLVLWQQGEADARQGTPPALYLARLRELDAQLARLGVDAPRLAARSTVCRSAPDAGLQQALAQLQREAPRRWPAGPDTDARVPLAWRHDGCHWGRQALAPVASAWRDAVLAALAR